MTGYQSLEHGILLGIAHAIEATSKNSIKKLCINASDRGIIEKMKRLDHLKSTEYLKKDGRPILTRDILVHLNSLLRLNNNMIIRWKYIMNSSCKKVLKMAEDLA